MQYEVVDGDLLESCEDVIIHQVNCQGVMGSGVAKAIRDKYPRVYELYKDKCNKCKSTSDMLGSIQIIQISTTDTKPNYCVNMYAQNHYGYTGQQYTSLEAFRECLQKINNDLSGFSVAFPWKIGCVRGGADWDTVLNMIVTELTDVESITFYKLDKG